MPQFTWLFFSKFDQASNFNFTLIQRAFLFTVWSMWGFLSIAVSQFCLRMGCRRRRSSFSVSDLCPCFQWLLGHDWSCMSLLWNIFHVPSTENTPPLASWRRLFFLFGPWWLNRFRQHPSGLWSFEFSSSDQYVSQVSSIVNNSACHCFAPFLDHRKPTQSEVEQNFVILTCTILPGSHERALHPQITEQDPIWRRRLEHRRPANKGPCTCFISSRCTEILADQVRNFVFLVRIGCVFEHAAPRHLLSFGDVFACQEAFSMQTQSSHQASSGKSLCTVIDRDVVSSSIDSIISTSLIQSIVIWGSAILWQTTALKLTFKLWKSIGFKKCISEIGILG